MEHVPSPESETLQRRQVETFEARNNRNGRKAIPRGEGDVIYIEKLEAQSGDTVTFEKVLAIIDEAASLFGAPLVQGASVSANVIKNGKGKKVRIFKMKSKKGYRKTMGHRQPILRYRSARSTQ